VTSSEKPVVDYNLYEVKVIIAIAKYSDTAPIDPTLYINVEPECLVLGIEDKPLNLNY
jgi:hypothetical protein